MRVEWFYQGQMTYSESYTVPRDDSDFCLWFFTHADRYGAFARQLVGEAVCQQSVD